MDELIHGKSISEWRAALPQLDAVMAAIPQLWINPEYAAAASQPVSPTAADIDAAASRLQRFAPYIARVFPETRDHDGLIESPLRAAPVLQREMTAVFDWQLPGRLLQGQLAAGRGQLALQGWAVFRGLVVHVYLDYKSAIIW